MNRSNARMPAGRLLLAIGILWSPVVVHADIFKWVDANGQVHFGDAPPKQVQASAVQLKPSSSPSTPEAVPALTDAQIMARQQQFTSQLEKERLQREAQLAQQKKRKDQLAYACERARNRLDHMKTVHVFYHENPNGTIRYLSDEEGDQLRKNARNVFKENCS